MAELKRESQNGFSAAVDALFQGMDHLVATKTVVGDAVKVDDAIILPLMDVTCGMAAGTFAENAKNKGAGGMSAKLSPSAVLVIQNGSTRLVNIKNQNTVNKMLDMVPDLVNRFTNGKMNVGEEFSEDALKAAREMAEEEKDI
ncbi:MAG: sporulation protein [Hungatella sp.]|nr:sporulation protein [Hungatella sp.]